MVMAKTSRTLGGSKTSGSRRTRSNADYDGNNNNNARAVNTVMLQQTEDDYEDERRGISVSIPVVVTPTNGDQEIDESFFVDTSTTFDDRLCDDTDSDADVLSSVNDDGRKTGEDLELELQETKEDARKTADALHSLWESVRMLQLFLQTPSTSLSVSGTSRPTKDHQKEEIDMNIRESSPPYSQQELLDHISALSNKLPGLLGDDMLGLTHAVCTQNDHIKLHTKEACMLTDDLTTARVAAIHAHERANRAESVSRRLYNEKQYLIEKVKRLSTERQILKDEVRTLRSRIESTRLYDAVTVHEHLLKTTTTPTSQQRQGHNANAFAFADDNGACDDDDDCDAEDRHDTFTPKSLELSSTSDQCDDMSSLRDLEVSTTSRTMVTKEEEAAAAAEEEDTTTTTTTATDITQPIRFLPTPKNNDNDRAIDDCLNNDPSSTFETKSSTKRLRFGLGFGRRFRVNKSSNTPSLPPRKSQQLQQQFDNLEDSEEDQEETAEEGTDANAGEAGA